MHCPASLKIHAMPCPYLNLRPISPSDREGLRTVPHPISPLVGEMPGRAEGGGLGEYSHYSAASIFPAIRRDRRASSL